MSYIQFRSGNIYWSTSGGREYSYQLILQNSSQMGYSNINGDTYIYNILNNSIEFIKILSLSSASYQIETIQLTLSDKVTPDNIIGILNSNYGLFILTAGGNIYLFNISPSLDSSSQFDISSIILTNTGHTYNTTTPFDGSVGFGIILDQLFISYPGINGRFIYQIGQSAYNDASIGYLKANYIPTDDFFP